MPPRNITTDDGRLFQDFDDNAHCRNCAACCRFFRVSFYHGELDSQPGGTVPHALATPVTPHLACMKGTEHGGSRCVALTSDNGCAIYERRPTTCREFLAFLPDGQPNPECRRLRKRLGILTRRT